MAMTRKEEKKIVDGKFYLVKYVVRAFMIRWEPVEAYRKEGKIYFLITGTNAHLLTSEVIEIIMDPIKLPEEVPGTYDANTEK